MTRPSDYDELMRGIGELLGWQAMEHQITQPWKLVNPQGQICAVGATCEDVWAACIYGRGFAFLPNWVGASDAALDLPIEKDMYWRFVPPGYLETLTEWSVTIFRTSVLKKRDDIVATGNAALRAEAASRAWYGWARYEGREFVTKTKTFR